MDRRKFVQSSVLAGLMSTVGKSVAGQTARTSQGGATKSGKGAAPRQAVILMTDATRRDMLNCYKVSGLHTPNLDRLAASGVRFERAYTTQPVCTPARSAIFTGTYPHSNGCWGNSMPLGNTVHNLGERLSQDGVHCGYIGKWHLDGYDYFGTGKASPGWDPAVWYDQRDYLEELSPDERQRSRNPATARDPKVEASFTFAHRCSTRAVEFIEKNKNNDFLLVVSYDEPHDPSIAPERYRTLYQEYAFPRTPNFADDLKDKPEEQRVWAGDALNAEIRPVREPAYFGALTFVDSEIGRVLDEIDKSTPGAFVLYTSDHGGMLQAHRLYGKGPAMYEEITNIPFIVRWQGHADGHGVSTVPVSHIDISGTLLEVFGKEVPKTFEGGSMLDSVKDPTHVSRANVFMEWGRYEVDHDGFGGFQPIRCICDGRWKLSIHLMTSDELYDLESDPGEMINLIDDPSHAELRNRMHDTLLAWMDTSRDPFRGYYWGRRAWRPEYPVSWENHGMTRQREEDSYSPRQLDYDTGLPMTKATRSKGIGASK
jgi:uncharacterized sulfatase